MIIKGVLWDLDGVLWDSGSAHAKAFALALGDYKLSDLNYSSFSGRKTIEVVSEILVGIEHNKRKIDEIVKNKQNYAQSILKESQPVSEFCVETIRALSMVCNQAIVSSSSKKNVELFLSCSGLSSNFAATISGDDCLYAKPSPEIYCLALDRLGLKPNESLVVEDSISGIRAADSAGIPVIGYRLPESVQLTEKIIFNAKSLREVLFYVQKNNSN